MKKKILIVSKFFYARGGAEVCAINQKEMFESRGHEVAVFAMQYPGTLTTSYNNYFPEEVNFSSESKVEKLKAFSRLFFSQEVKLKFLQLLDDFQPEIVHLHNIHSYLSPLVAKLAKERGFKVIWTIHDHKLVCPAYGCLRKDKVCEICFTNKWNVIRTKCMKNSMSASIAAYLEAIWWNKDKLMRYTDTFVCPSQHMKRKMLEGGFNESKLTVLSNYIEDEKLNYLIQNRETEKSDYYCYVGRISEEKGIRTLLKASLKTPYTLKIAGNGPLINELKEKYESDKVQFLGHISPTEVVDLIGKAKVSIMPSVCSENNPLSVIDSLCIGTPVIGSRIGGIPELIDEEINGLIVPAANDEALSKAIFRVFKEMQFDYKSISKQAIDKYSESEYYQKITEIYSR